MRGNMLVRWERGLSRKLGFYPLQRYRIWATVKPYKSGANPPEVRAVMPEILPGGGVSRQ